MNTRSSSHAQVSLPLTLEELLDLDDDSFVQAAYLTVLGREADQEGLAYYLRRARSGIGKLHILGQLRHSPEGRSRATNVSGLDKAIRFNKLKNLLGFNTAPEHRNEKQDSRLRAVENVLHSLARTVVSTNQQITNLHASLERLRKTSPRRYLPAPSSDVGEPGVPLVSILTPVYKTSVFYLERLATSMWPVRDSIEWVIVNDSPGTLHVEAFIKRMQSCFPHIQYVHHKTNQGIFAAYSSGVMASTAPYIAILDHDDEVDLAPIASHLKQDGDRYDLVYTDEVRFGQGVNAYFAKPSFDPLSAMHYFYMHHITLFRTEICKSLIDKEPDATKKYRSCFDIWLALGYIRHHGATPITSKYVAYPSYGWRVHDDSTAKNLGQKPLADGERIEIARKLYSQHDAFADIVLDDEARYVVRYVYPIASPQDRTQFTNLLCSLFDIFTPRMTAIDEHKLSRGDMELVKALSKVPLAYLKDLVDGKCVVLQRNKVPRESQIRERISRHIDGVPVLEPVDGDWHLADVANLVNQSIGILLPKSASKMKKEQPTTHLLIV
jgi:glycosyltransferase involved in cell wall biosynthesis